MTTCNAATTTEPRYAVLLTVPPGKRVKMPPTERPRVAELPEITPCTVKSPVVTIEHPLGTAQASDPRASSKRLLR